MPSQVAEEKESGIVPSGGGLLDEDLPQEDWEINHKSPSPQPLGEAAPPLTQPMEGEAIGKDVMDDFAAAKQLLVVACQASATALAPEDDSPQKMDPPETVNAGVANAVSVVAMSHTLARPQSVWAATTDHLFPVQPQTGELV